MEMRKKLNAAISLFLICVIVMLYTSYAWLTISRAPEVSSIETNVGANGSLEIALLNDDTFVDPTTIRTSVGDSLMSQDPLISNIAWGNVIDLSSEGYGLQDIALRPSRLNLTMDAEGNSIVGDNILMVADFGNDGRVTFLADNTVSGVFAEEHFSFHSEYQTHGVRGIGVAGNMSPRQKAFSAANSMVPMYNASAIHSAQNVWRENGPVLMSMWERKVLAGLAYVYGAEYTEPEFAAIIDSGEKTLEAYEYVDKAICHAFIGIAAIELTDEQLFEDFYDLATRPGMSAYDLAGFMPKGMFPNVLVHTLEGLERVKTDIRNSISICKRCQINENGFYSSYDLDLLLSYIGFWQSYLNDYTLFSEAQEAYDHLREDNALTLVQASALGELAGFTGNYSISFGWGSRNIQVSTVHPLQSSYMPIIPYLIDRLAGLTLPTGPIHSEIFDLYGFAIDLAFRCNTTTDLLLQTEQALRLRETTEAPATQGGGSYLRFRSGDMTREQLISLIDTLRLGFVDNRNHLVALAKANVSNYKEDIDGSITAPLYLYEYTVTTDGCIRTGERRSEDTCILPLTQSSPEHLTAILWMDGDYVDNSMVNIDHKTMTGVINLQFASSVDLSPSGIPITGVKDTP